MSSAEKCTLCGSANTDLFFFQKKFKRNFFQCGECDLVFAQRDTLLELNEEKKRYSSHNNHIRSEGYEFFLRRLIDPIEKFVTKNSKGLDFGEGPYPMMQEIMKDDGYLNVIGFDIHFNNDIKALESRYDFVMCSEVIEHIYDLRSSWELILGLLEPGGYLAISTGLRYETLNFEKWHYIQDETHINFLSPSTLEWLKEKYDLEIAEIGRDMVIFLQK